MSSRRRSSTHTASRARSTASAPASNYFSAFTSPYSSQKPRSGGASSAYKRSPRPNFLVRAYERIRKLIRRFIRYARKNPLKVIVPLVLALIGGGALTGLVRRMGGLEALGLGGLTRSIGVNQIIGVGHGLRTASDGFPGMRGDDFDRGDGMGNSSFDPWSMGKGAIKIASAFL